MRTRPTVQQQVHSLPVGDMLSSVLNSSTVPDSSSSSQKSRNISGRYIGRFAPSPTGPLHFGSLIAALASYLDARSCRGTWLVRIEDLDPPREVPGASDLILKTLENYGLHWDGTVVYQSDRHQLYQDHIDQLLTKGLAYFCECSRQAIAQRGPVYDGFCRTRQLDLEGETAIRVKTDRTPIEFDDRIQGFQSQCLEQHCGDFVIRRKDLLYAYQIAVVCDDAAQEISHVVRGSDLLESTPRQLFLQQLLGFSQPCYAHIPVVVNEQGQKLSKQTYATALDDQQPQKGLFKALQFLGQQPPSELQQGSPAELLAWAIDHWSPPAIPRQMHFAQVEN